MLTFLLCLLHLCSNDSLGLPVLGDEVLAWEAVPDTDLQAYEVWRQEGPCLVVNPALTSIRVSGTSCLAPNDTALLRVRACDTGGLCGDFSNEVEFLPFTCISGREEVTLGPDPRDTFNPNCEAMCFADATYRLPEDRRCQ